MKYIYLIGLLLFMSTASLKAERINITVKAYPEASYVFYLYQGAANDTVAIGKLDRSGSVQIQMPMRSKGYVGFANLQLKNGMSVKFIVDGSDFSISTQALIPEQNNLQIEGSAENKFLIENGDKQRVFTDSVLYAQRYLKGLNYNADSLILNLDALYRSPAWNDMLHQFIKVEQFKSDETVADDMEQIVRNTQSQVAVDEFLNNMMDYWDSKNLTSLEYNAISQVYDLGVVTHPTRQLQPLMKRMGVLVGETAPDFRINKTTKLSDCLGKSEIVLFFYASGCYHCENAIEQLKRDYPKIRKTGIRFISIGMDSNSDLFLETSKSFPWKDRVCDPEMVIAIKYGIMYTPTFFTIGLDGKLKKRANEF